MKFTKAQEGEDEEMVMGEVRGGAHLILPVGY